ncbi:MAG: endolytic transglycosylase MltG, partial [Halieaceae bacterium]|nr:endolytic transglycosylase MltG [Halieaceae bacterium]
IQYEVTLPEGISLHQALQLLSSQPQLQTILEGVGDPRLLALVAPRNSAEGLFFPDTYRFNRGDTDLGILRRAQFKMERELEREWSLRQEQLPLSSPYEALILASIIEKETGLAAERERIAGVFVRRLQRRMRLQADPTVIYGLGESFTGNLRRSHIEDASNPYNTYRHFGLPPTPIALAGGAALRAALHPAAGNELYFVARGDGSHEFSAIMEQHERAVRRYQRKRAVNYHSAPAARNR